MINTCLFGDCRDGLRQIKAAGIRPQTVVTSPPYYGLRDYGHPGQLGLERTPDEYIASMVEVFRAVRDVLSDDGTLWLNIGDSYNSIGHKKSSSGYGTSRLAGGEQTHSPLHRETGWKGAKHKDLIGIPWMLAFALRADGWYLRQDIIWHKPNQKPESVRDRCTKAHEYLFLLSKSARYYFDSAAIAERVAQSTIERLTQPTLSEQVGSARVPGKTNGNMKAVGGTDTRNRRSVWTIATTPYSGAHFATFPPALIEPCILAGSRPGDVVLDPFLGSGTTARVAMALGRQWIGCEINPEYKDLQDGRTERVQMRIDGAQPVTHDKGHYQV